MSAYALLEAHFAQLNALEGAQSILHWDSEVMMPSGSVDVRAEQLCALAGIAHRLITDPSLPERLDDASSEDLNVWQRANLHEMQRQHIHASALPDALVESLSHATTQSEHAWREARTNNDYKGFMPHLQRVLSLVREVAARKAERLSCCPYDALLDSYDPAMRSAEIDALFSELEGFLPNFVQEVMEHQRTHVPYMPIAKRVDIAAQHAISHELMQALGFDFNRGRADSSAHPFCGGVVGDIRLTSRYDEHNLIEGLYATLHETGHALYEMGLPQAWRTQPVGKARGMSLHESQSLLTEMQLGLRPAFIRFVLERLHAHTSLDSALWNEANLHAHLTRVKPTLIRVTADEVTYPLHVMLRYKLEKALLSGELPLEELPLAWDDAMHKALGIRPDCVGNGCLQDTHWAGGAFGYFPTYSIGAIIAAQLMDAACSALPNLDGDIEQGHFTPLYAWLGEQVHAKASHLSTQEIVQQATGKSLNADLYKQHLTKRYLP